MKNKKNNRTNYFFYFFFSLYILYLLTYKNMDTTTPPPTTTPSLPIPSFDQIVKGNVSIKKISKHKYRITFSKIGKFLVYQVWDKDYDNLNRQRDVIYLSAKEWVDLFNNHNKYLEKKQKPLFTPTTIMENEDEYFAFVLYKARINSCGHIVFTVSTKEISSSKKLTKLHIGGIYKNVRFDIDADNNGYGIVYNRSNCGATNVRSYALGGRASGGNCGTWLLDEIPRKIIWYANPPNEYIVNKNEHNWNLNEIDVSNWPAVFKWNGWCDNVYCKPSENQNPPSYIPS